MSDIESLRAQVAALEAREPRRPDLLERLSYHALERDDLTVEDCIEYLANGWTRVHGRTERQMVMQLLHLMAGGYTSEREAALEAERDQVVYEHDQAEERLLERDREIQSLQSERDALEAEIARLARPVVPMNEGELWSWVRSVMSQGADIRCDYDQGVHKGYEAYSARLDAAAAARSQELIARITEVSPAPVPLTYEHILSAIHSLGKEGQGRIALTFESGPYDIDEPTIVAVQFARAVINEFCRINGIGGER